MSRSRRPPSYPPVTVAPLETSSIPGRRPDSPMPQFDRRPDTRVNLLWGQEEHSRRHSSQPEFPAIWPTVPSSMGFTGGLVEDFKPLETSGGLVEDEDSNVSEIENFPLTDGFGRCAQTLEEAKINLDHASKTTRAMKNLEKSVELPLETKITAAAGFASGANKGISVNMRGNSGSIKELDAAGSCGLISGSMATDSANNGYLQPTSFQEASSFSHLERPIMYLPPPPNPERRDSTRRSSPSRPSIDPLQRPSHHPRNLISDPPLPQNLSSNPDDPNFTLPRHPSSRPAFTSPTDPTSRNSTPTSVYPRLILNSQHIALCQPRNFNLGPTPSQNPSSSQQDYSSRTILPMANLHIRLNYPLDPTNSNDQYHEPRQPTPDPSPRSAPRFSTLRPHQHQHQHQQAIPLLTWRTFECRRWIFKLLITEHGYDPNGAFTRAQKFHGAGADLYLMRFSQWYITIGNYRVASRIHLKLSQNASASHATDRPQHEPASGA